MGRDHPFSAFAKLPLKLTFLPTHTHTYEMLLKTHKTLFPVGITCSKLTTETLEQGVKYVQSSLRRSGVFIVNFEHISHPVLVFRLLTLRR